MTQDRCLEIEREKKHGRGNDSRYFSDQYSLPCFLCKHSTIVFQNRNEIFQHKN